MLRTYAEVKQAISSGDTVMSILEGYLSAIEENKDLNAFLEVFENSARLQAKLVDEKITNRTAGRLAGMVIGLKDNMCFRKKYVVVNIYQYVF